MKLCDINEGDVYRYLGFQNQEPDETTKKQVAEAQEKLKTASGIKGTYKIIPIISQEPITLEGTTLDLPGKNIKLLLKESHHCILMAVTLGHQVDRWIREAQIRDMSQAVVLDACASSLAEEYCNQLEEDIRNEWKSGHFTDRFSPGYGDLPLTVQPPLCKILDTEKKIGLTLSTTNLMAPKKSITALIGIADTPQPMRIKGCGFCSLRENCMYRKGGKTCGS